jgi:hybrid cluster-associated redox disulfide protein
MAQVTKDMLIHDILQVDRELAVILLNHGMRCVGCPSAASETLEQAAISHGFDPDELLEEMNVFLQTRGAYDE